MRQDALGMFHPAVVFAFFMGAIVLCVLVSNPLIQLAGFLCAAAFYLCIHGRKGLKVVLGMIPLIIVLTVINPLFNTWGDTILFRWLWERPYTLEALGYGLSMGLMFTAVLLWFLCYNKVMTSDRLTYLFGAFAPSITLVLTMVLRLVPTYQRKVKEIASARACVGHSLTTGDVKERAESGATLLSTLTTWALEGSVITADSMRSRGFGSTKKRTTYAAYRFTLRDGVLLAVMVILFSVSLACVLSGAGAVEYFPIIVFPPIDPFVVVTTIAFVIFLAIPTIISTWEAVSWSISLSKI